MGPLQAFHRTLSEYQKPLLILTATLTGLGFLLLFGPFFVMMLAGEGRPMTRGASLEMSRRGVA